MLIPAVGWSRVVLRAHTLAQVVAGSLFGGLVMAGLWWLSAGLAPLARQPQAAAARGCRQYAYAE